MNDSEYEAAAIQASVALTLIRNKLVYFYNEYALLKDRNGSDAEVRELVEKGFSDWEVTLTTTDELKSIVNKVMRETE